MIGGMRHPDLDREYVVLVSHWQDGWDVFVLDPLNGLVLAARAAHVGDVDDVANTALSERFGVPPRRFKLAVIRN